MSSLKPHKKQRITKRNHKQKMFEAAINHVQNIYDASEKTANIFKTHGVTIAAFEEICNAKKVTKMTPETEEFYTKLNAMVQAIFDLCKQEAEKMNSQIIPLEIIKEIVSFSKDQASKSFNQKPTANDGK